MEKLFRVNDKGLYDRKRDLRRQRAEVQPFVYEVVYDYRTFDKPVDYESLEEYLVIPAKRISEGVLSLGRSNPNREQPKSAQGIKINQLQKEKLLDDLREVREKYFKEFNLYYENFLE